MSNQASQDLDPSDAKSSPVLGGHTIPPPEARTDPDRGTGELGSEGSHGGEPLEKHVSHISPAGAPVMANEPKPTPPRKETPHVEPKQTDPKKQESTPQAAQKQRRQ
jgi:hypothetical protein